jgi:uncharacterized membrane protein YgdD (TMEM256/DUF423 family)
MTAENFRKLACGLGFLAVALGAFGAHGLKSVLEQHQTAAVWQTAVFYHFVHTVMIYVVSTRDPFRKVSAVLFLVGIVIFSGSLYALAVTNLRWLGMITPVGGAAFLAGWVALAVCKSGAPKA